MGRPRDRRASIRYPVIDHRAVLAWEDGNGHRQVDARIVNLSHTGALLVAQSILPAEQRPVWVRLQEPCLTDWVDALVVRTARGLRSRLTGDGTCLVRLRFLPTCPNDFLEGAVHGRAAADPAHQAGASDREVRVRR